MDTVGPELVRHFNDDCFLIEPKFVPKVWGCEEHIVNHPLGYCGKRLTVIPHAACSIHFHRAKSETFFIEFGVLHIALFKRDFTKDEKLGGIRCHILLGRQEEPADAFLREPEILKLYPGQALQLPPFTPHCFWNPKVGPPVRFFEFSTRDDPNDSYRLKLSVAGFFGEQPDLSF